MIKLTINNAFFEIKKSDLTFSDKCMIFSAFSALLGGIVLAIMSIFNYHWLSLSVFCLSVHSFAIRALDNALTPIFLVERTQLTFLQKWFGVYLMGIPFALMLVRTIIYFFVGC